MSASSQFHLPTGKPQRLRGRIGLVIPDREALLQRLENMKKPLEGTQFAFKEHKDHVEATCPWGNKFLVYEPSSSFGRHEARHALCRVRRAGGHRQGHRRLLSQGASGTVTTSRDGDTPAAHVTVGYGQELVFRETDRPSSPAYDGHHIQVYVANFSQAAQAAARAQDLVTEESNQYQYRFERSSSISASGKQLFEIEHEIRSMTHPLYARPLVNRNPAQTNRNYVPGRDAWVPELEDADMGDPRRAMREQRYQEATGRPLAAD